MNSRISKPIVLLSTLLLIISCDEYVPQDQDWIIPQDLVFDGGPGKDGIPALENPKFTSAEEASYLDDTDLVIGYVNGDDVRAYPHSILDWHEIINDEVNGHPVAITHCPLTRTSIGWEREYDGVVSTFGVSGLLYETNLMPYDRATNTTWSQQRQLAVNGPLIGTEAKTFQIVETEWGVWKALYPETKVVSEDTGHSRNYRRYPYGDYRASHRLIFAVSQEDNRLPRKERVHGVIVNERVKVYRFGAFSSENIIVDSFEGESFTVIGSVQKNIILSFREKLIDGETLTFEFINNLNSPVFLRDQLGNEWDIFGHAVSGPNVGERLESTNSFIGMAFSWASFYGLPEIYGVDTGG